MFKSLIILAEHMKKEHPDSEWFGDSIIADNNNNNIIISQKCQICGKELVNDTLSKFI